jgi:hypothetical protein
MIGARLGAGREAEVFVWGGAAVLKLYRPGFGGHETEASALRQLEGRGVAPRLIGVVDHDQRRGLVLERLHGSDMLALLQREPWRLLNLARGLARAHLRIHEVEAPDGLPDLRDVVAARIHSTPLPSHLRDFALRELTTLPAGDRLVHGDYHPGNLLITPGQQTVIDWTAASRGAPDADYARTLLLLRRADPLPGTPLVARVLMAAGRSAFARAYSHAYRRGRSEPVQNLSSWLTVVTAARMSEGIDVERPRLLGLLDTAWRRRAHYDRSRRR